MPPAESQWANKRQDLLGYVALLDIVVISSMILLFVDILSSDQALLLLTVQIVVVVGSQALYLSYIEDRASRSFPVGPDEARRRVDRLVEERGWHPWDQGTRLWVSIGERDAVVAFNGDGEGAWVQVRPHPEDGPWVGELLDGIDEALAPPHHREGDV